MHTILVPINGPGLGDFIHHAAGAALAKIKVPNSKVYGLIYPDSHHKLQALRLFPGIDYLVYAKPDLPMSFFADCIARNMGQLPEVLQGGPGFPPRAGLAKPILLFAGYGDVYANCLEFRKHVVAQIPDDIAQEGELLLKALGLRRDRWFATLHVREPGYRRDGALHPRNVQNLQPYIELVRHLIAQGGQVVRLGDPSMTPFPPMDGLYDLSRVPDSLLFQAFATSRARFAVQTASGMNLGQFFHVPTIFTNHIPYDTMAFDSGLFPENHIICTKTFVLEDGQRVHDRGLYGLGGRIEDRWRPYPERLEENSPELLKASVDLMLDRTNDDPWPLRSLALPDKETDKEWLARMLTLIPEELELNLPVTFIRDFLPNMTKAA